jgi:hypothetical protein
MGHQQVPVHRTIVAVDVEGFGDRHRTNPIQRTIRHGLYHAMQEAFAQAGIPWADCYHEDRGDGIFILVGPEVPKSLFVESLPSALVGELCVHNSARADLERIRLRMALHAGEINFDEYGASGASINLTFRLLESGPVKEVLGTSPGVLAIITSSWFFEEVVRHIKTGAATYRPFRVEVKETTTTGWICLPECMDWPDLPPEADLPERYQSHATEYHRMHEPPERKIISEVAAELARIVGKQWAEEVRMRQLNDYPELLVSWASADPSLAVGWKELTSMAERGADQLATSAGIWADGPDGLEGSGHDLPNVLKRVPTGWVVVLGEPGSGKSTLMARLVLDLLKRHRTDKDAPVPVLVSLTSWDPGKDGQDLFSWLEDRIIIDHDYLRVPVSTEHGAPSRIQALLSARMIVPILDGLDEMPLAARQAAIARLNAAFDRPESPQHLLLTCRAKEYKQAVWQPDNGGWFPLRPAAAIELRPLELEHVKAYLTRDGRDTRWMPVVNDLERPQSVIARALRTPLAVSLAAAIYNPHPGEPADKAERPGELCETSLYPDAGAILDHLLGRFVPAAYRSDPDSTRAKKATRRLIFLARYLVTRRSNTGNRNPTLEWWDIEDAAPAMLVPVVVGAVCGISTAIAAGLGTHVGVGIGIGFGAGMLITLAVGLAVRRVTHFHGGPLRSIAGTLIGAVLGGLAAGVAGKMGIGHTASLFSNLPADLGIGIGAGTSASIYGGLGGGLVGGFVGGLLEGYGLGLPAALVNGLGVGLAAGFAVHYIGHHKPARRRPEWDSIGLVSGLVTGLALGLITWRANGIAAGIVVGILISCFCSWACGLRNTHENLDAVPSPREALRRDIRAFRYTSLACGLAAAATGFVGIGLSSVYEVGARASLSVFISGGLGVGLATGLVIALVFGFHHAASPTFLIVSWWLALRRRMPWRLMHFLTDAHKRGVLRQSGADFEFRHTILQEHLAKTRLEPDIVGKPGAGICQADSPPATTANCVPQDVKEPSI